MKRNLIAAALLMLVASAAGAATKGSNELLFQFDGFSGLGANQFRGGIGLRHYMSDNMAVRPGVRLTYNTEKTDGVGGSTDEKLTTTGLGVDVAIEKHMGGSKKLSPYMGAEVSASFGRGKDEFSHAASPATGTFLTSTGTNTGISVAGLLGFQWFWTENVSLGGEYQLGLGVGSSKIEDTFQAAATTTTKGSGMNLGLGTGRLALSVAL